MWRVLNQSYLLEQRISSLLSPALDDLRGTENRGFGDLKGPKGGWERNHSHLDNKKEDKSRLRKKSQDLEMERPDAPLTQCS